MAIVLSSHRLLLFCSVGLQYAQETISRAHQCHLAAMAMIGQLEEKVTNGRDVCTCHEPALAVDKLLTPRDTIQPF